MAKLTLTVKKPADKLASPLLGNGAITIAQVAREAGVSKTSVSRYLGGELDALSERIREQIAATIARLGYQPNQMARGLKRGRTRLIGMLVADVLNPYSVAVLQGAEAACQQHGYTLMLCNTGNDEKREQQSLAALRSYSVEGLIVHTQGRSADALAALERSGLPVVLVDRKIAGLDLDLVGLDNAQASRLATEHLMAQGFTDIGFVTSPLQGVSSRQEREAGFRSVLAENPAHVGLTIEVSPDDPAALEQALQAFLAARPGRRVALLAANGVITLQIALTLHKMGLQFPQDIGLLGFDELAWSPLVGPGITTLAQPTYEIGFSAMTCLLARINREETGRRTILLPGQLITRGSTDVHNCTTQPVAQQALRRA